MLLLCFVWLLYIIWTYKKYLLFAVLDKTEIIIFELNIFFRFFIFPEIFRKLSGKYFSEKATSLHTGMMTTLSFFFSCSERNVRLCYVISGFVLLRRGRTGQRRSTVTWSTDDVRDRHDAVPVGQSSTSRPVVFTIRPRVSAEIRFVSPI